NVDVDRAGIELEKKNVRRLALAVQQLRIRLARRVGEQPVAHEAAVDEEVLAVGARPGGVRAAGEAGQADAAALRIHGQRCLQDVRAEQSGGALARRLGADMAADPAVVLQGECYLRVRERHAPEYFVAMAELGG